MRVGVDTGDVVVSTLGDRGGSEFVVVGQTVNRASRLEGAAPPGGILISEDTHRQIRGRFSMERREGLILKGIDEPVVAYLVVNERPHVFQLDRRAASRASRPRRSAVRSSCGSSRSGSGTSSRRATGSW